MTKYYGIKTNSNYVIKNDGTLWEIGRNRRITNLVPNQVGTLTDWNLLGSGVRANAFIKSDGSLWTCGYNASGQLGIGDNIARSSPIKIGTSQWKQVSTGSYFDMGVQTNGTLWAWGRNDWGNFGGPAASITPVQVGTISNWTKVSCGYTYAFGLQSDGTLWGWGLNNGGGRLGLNTTAQMTTPVQIKTGAWLNVDNFKVGYGGAALNSNGTIWTWGEVNSSGQLGTSDLTARRSPVQVGSSTNWTQISCGVSNVAAIQSDGTLWMWGSNAYGQLGQSDTTNRSTPIQVGSLSNWSQISCGYYHTIAIKTDNTLWGWGRNDNGQVGLNTTTNILSPIQIGLLSNWARVGCGDYYTSLINSSGQLFTMGATNFGQLGYIATSYRSDANQVGYANNWSTFPVGSQNTSWSAALDTSDTLYTFGDNSNYISNYQCAISYGYSSNNVIADGQLIASPTPIATSVTQASIGGGFGVYTKTDGTLWGWGNTSYGQLTDPSIPFVQPAWFNTQPVKQVSGGAVHTVLLNSNGTMWIQGSNAWGQLGTSNLTYRSSPVQVGDLNNWAQVDAGYTHSAAVNSNGQLYVWGNNSFGQLGQNNQTLLNSPTIIGSRYDVSWNNVFPGVSTLFAIKPDGTLWGIGANTWGQLGIGAADNSIRTSLVQIGTDSNWAQITNNDVLGAAQGDGIIGIKTDGTMWSWGGGAFAELGLNTTANVYRPTQIGTDNTWSKVVLAGRGSALALKTNGTLWVWGRNEYGQLGLSNTTNVSTPVQLGTANNWSTISVGLDHIALVNSLGQLWVCGANSYGQLGFNDTLANRLSPVQLGALTNWKSASCGSLNTLAIKTDGTLWAWGYNNVGQLGLSDTTNRSSPVQVGTLTNWNDVSATDSNTFGLKSDGTLWSWGSSAYNMLGQGAMRSSPVQVGADAWTSISNNRTGALRVAVALNSNGKYYVWGGSNTGTSLFGDNIAASIKSSPVQFGTWWQAPESNWSQVSLGQFHSYAVNSGGTLWGWGNNSFGQLASNNQVNQSVPVQIGTDAKTWIEIGAGKDQISGFGAIRSDGTLWTWNGNNQFGMLGLNTTTAFASPVQVGNLTDWSKLAIGQYHMVAIKTNGTLWSWGGNSWGQLGTSDLTHRSSPTQIGTLSNWNKIVCGYFHTAAIKADGTLWAWGNNSFGQLGNSNQVHTYSPIQIGSLTNWSFISSETGRSTAAIKTDGTLWAWGNNSFGQLGLSDFTNRSSPVQVGTLTNWNQVACGYRHTVAVKTDGTLWTWGNNAQGQLGTSNMTNYNSPVQVGNLTNWVTVSVSNIFSLASKTDGTLWGWGSNNNGQLGNGNTATTYSSPIQIGTQSNWNQTKFEARDSMGYAINTNGYLYSWGKNDSGQLGIGFLYNGCIVPTPSQIGSGFVNNISLINTGSNHALAIKNDGTLWTWGNNSYGQLGLNHLAHMTNQQQIGTSNGWTDASGGLVHSAAINNGYLYAWGNNSYGQLGQNNSSNYFSPIIVGAQTLTYSRIFSGSNAIFLIDLSNRLYVSGGDNSTYGALGLGDLTNRSTPVQVGNLTNWAQVSNLSGTTLAIKTDGTLWGWGDAGSYQLGSLTQGAVSSPVQISTLSNWSRVEYYSNMAFALQSNGTLWTWGTSSGGVSGLNTSSPWTNTYLPTQVGTDTWKDFSLKDSMFAIKTDGTLWGWGSNAFYQLLQSDTTNRSSPVQVSSDSNWKQVVGYFGATALKTDGTLWAWGLNTTGALGLGDKTNRSSPTQIGTGSTWIKISGQTGQAIYGLKSDGTIWTWGTSYSTPVQVGSKTNWVDINASYYAVATALDSSGNAWVWGDNASGKLGQNNTASVYSLPTILGYGLYNDWSQVTCGYYNTIALRSNGTLWTMGLNSYGALGLSDQTHRSIPTQVGNLSNCTNTPNNVWQSMFVPDNTGKLFAWGNNTYGQLGRLGATLYSHIQIGSKSNWTKIHAGTAHWLGIDSNNTLWAQGNNSWGQLGTSDLTHRSSPTQVGTLSNWSQIACGDVFSAALKTDGTMWAWGNNSYGQLGQADYTHRYSPVQVGSINRYITLYTMTNTILAELS